MAHFFNQSPPPHQQPYGGGSGGSAAAAQNLQFYPSAYASSSPYGGGGGGGGVAASTYPSGGMGFGGGSRGGAGAAGGMGFGAGAGAGGGAGAFGGIGGRMGDSSGGLRTGWLAAFGTEGYEGEPPLLEELGVNFAHIRAKTLTVLNPFARIDQHIMDDSDLAGPLLFFLLFGTFLLFSGKVHFSYIYGLAILGSTSLHVILSLMAPPVKPSDYDDPHGRSPVVTSSSSAASRSAAASSSSASASSSSLTFPRSASVLGYCLLPLVLTSLVGIVLPMDALPGYILTSAAIVWCTYSSSGMFCAVGRMRRTRALVAYPLALFYVGFGIMVIFSSRGSGNLASIASGSSYGVGGGAAAGARGVVGGAAGGAAARAAAHAGGRGSG